MVQSAEKWRWKNAPDGLNGTRYRRVFVESEMCPSAVIILHGFDTLSCFTCQASQSAAMRHWEINGLRERHNGKMPSNPPLLT